MAIGTDDIDFMENGFDSENLNETENYDESIDNYFEGDEPEDPSSSETNSEDFIETLLKTKGIEDKSKIKIENEDGDIQETSWDQLDNTTKINILNSSDEDLDLDEQEIQLINSIRQSQLSPTDYLQYVQRSTIDNYLRQNQMNSGYVYKVDDISDDELFMTDFMARMNSTESEALEALERSKGNEQLFKKQINAIRSEYKRAEDETLQYHELQRQEAAQAEYAKFANTIGDKIANFTEFAGCDLNMSQEDMQQMYEFIVGYDAAGNNHFGKALADPDTLVKMAWFALHGEDIIQDINEYYKKEISKVRKESYNKGVQSKGDKPIVVHKNIQTKSKSTIYDDLDDF